MAKGNQGNQGTGNRGRATYGRRFPVIGAKKRKPGRPRKARLALTTAGAFPVGYGMPEPVEPEAEEVEGDDVDDVTPEEEEERASEREEESESK